MQSTLELDPTPSKSFPRIPPELVCEILKYVDNSELPTMALLGPLSQTYQGEAERLLYRRIVLNNWQNKKNRSCLATLAIASHKARLVHSLIISWWNSSTRAATRIEALGQCLLGMTSLKHLDMAFSEEVSHIPTILNPILRRCTFSIITLHISDYFDLASWVPKQRTLKSIGIYSYFGYPSPAQLSFYKELVQNSPQNNPLTLYHFHCGRRCSTDTLLAFPTFTHHWSAKHIYTSSFKDITTRILYFELLLTSLSDETVLRPAIASISQYFPDITSLRLIVADPDIHENPHNLSSILSLIPDLTDLCIYYQDLEGLDWEAHELPYQANTLGLARLWAAKCPKLQFVSFLDRTTIYTASSNTEGSP